MRESFNSAFSAFSQLVKGCVRTQDKNPQFAEGTIFHCAIHDNVPNLQSILCADSDVRIDKQFDRLEKKAKVYNLCRTVMECLGFNMNSEIEMRQDLLSKYEPEMTPRKVDFFVQNSGLSPEILRDYAEEPFSSIVNIKDAQGRTPTMFAIANHSNKVLKLLIEKGNRFWR